MKQKEHRLKEKAEPVGRPNPEKERTASGQGREEDVNSATTTKLDAETHRGMELLGLSRKVAEGRRRRSQ